MSGGQKPLYRAFGDLADGYDLWERFHYRQAWEKLKTAVKAFEMASLWGGPPGLTSLLPPIKANAGFLEKLVLDPAPVKDMQAPDLLAYAGRRLHGVHDPETAMVSLVRALEAFAQRQLFKQYQSKPGTCSPTVAAGTSRDLSILLAGRSRRQVQIAVAGAVSGAGRIGRPMGEAFLREWPTMKPLLDAANHAVLGHGFEPVKAERVQQLYDVVVKLSGVSETSLPKFPVLAV